MGAQPDSGAPWQWKDLGEEWMCLSALKKITGRGLTRSENTFPSHP